MSYLAEKIVFSLSMASFALAVWMAVRPSYRRLLPDWMRILTPHFSIRSSNLDRQAHAVFYILFFLTWIPVIWLLE